MQTIHALRLEAIHPQYMMLYTEEAPASVVERPIPAQALPPGIVQSTNGHFSCVVCRMLLDTQALIDEHVRTASHKDNSKDWAGVERTDGGWRCAPCKFSTTSTAEMAKHVNNKSHRDVLKSQASKKSLPSSSKGPRNDMRSRTPEKRTESFDVCDN